MSTERLDLDALGEDSWRHRTLAAMKAKLVLWADELAEQAPASFDAQLGWVQEVAASGPELEAWKEYLALAARRTRRPNEGWKHNDLYITVAGHLTCIEEGCCGDGSLFQEAASQYVAYARNSYAARQLVSPRWSRGFYQR